MGRGGPKLRMLLCLALLVMGGACSRGGDVRTSKLRTARVETSDGLALEFAANGSLRGVFANGKAVPLRGPGGFYLAEVLAPNGKVKDHGLLPGAVSVEGNSLCVQGRTSDGLQLVARLTASDRLEIAGEIRDKTGKDRAVIVEFVLPVDCTGWTYENTPWQSRTIDKSLTYPGEPHRGTVDICRTGPPQAGKTGFIVRNRLPFNAVRNAHLGLSLGVPMAQPRIFFMSVDPRGVVMRFNLGVTALTKKFPSRATFRFCLFRHEPAWGIRSAAERFYRFYPELYATKAVGHGNLCSVRRMNTGLPKKRDFGISYVESDFQWRDGQFRPAVAKLIADLGLRAFHWREPWSWFHKTSRKTTAKQEMAMLQELAKKPAKGKSHGQYCGAPLGLCARAALTSCLQGEDGSPVRVRYEYGCWMLGMNLDPELPHPNRADVALDHQYKWLRQWGDPDYRGPRNYAWDSCTSWTGENLCNFRREHFKYVDNPLTFNPKTGSLCQLKVLHDWEFAVHHSRLVRKKGGLICGNVSPMSALFYGHCIDVFVQETEAKVRGDEGITMRMLIGRKPFAFYRPSNGPGPVRLAMFYGFAPGIDATKEARRSVARQYMPVIQAIGRAGWEPVTRARSPGLKAERFGRKPGDLYFTVRYQDKNLGAKDAALRIDAGALGIDPAKVRVEEIAERRPLRQHTHNGGLLVSFKINFEETLVFAVRGK